MGTRGARQPRCFHAVAFHTRACSSQPDAFPCFPTRLSLLDAAPWRCGLRGAHTPAARGLCSTAASARGNTRDATAELPPVAPSITRRAAAIRKCASCCARGQDFEFFLLKKKGEIREIARDISKFFLNISTCDCAARGVTALTWSLLEVVAPRPVTALACRWFTHYLPPHLTCCGCCGNVAEHPELVGYTRAWMGSSSAQRVAAWAPPPPDQLAAFYKLVDKRVIAGVLCREARHAELSGQAAVQAEALFGDDSLVVASLRYNECCSLNNLACEATGAEQDLLLHQSLAALLLVIPLLLRRLENNTLLPGTLRKEELTYEVHGLAAVKKAMNDPLPPPAVLRAWASTMGYTTLMLAVARSLDLLLRPVGLQNERKLVESFVLQGLDVIPRTAGIPADLINGEENLVTVIAKHLSPQRHGPAFYAAVLRKWQSDAVSNVLCARGMLQTGIAKCEQDRAKFIGRQRADIAKHGLRNCALPSCSKTEKTVKEFAGCSGCRSVVYCCLEHQALDWRAHKKACREIEAARRAAEEAEEGAEEGTDGGAGAT